MQNVLISGKSSVKLKLDPRTKLLLTFVISVVMITGKITGAEEALKVCMAIIPFILFFVEGKKVVGIVYIIAIFSGFYLEYFILDNASGLVNLIALVISGLINRMVPALMMGAYTINTTTVSEFIASMERMKVSNKITIPMSVMFRFFPTIADESKSINDAMKMRGITKKDMLKRPLVYLEYKLVPLLMSIVKIGDELSAAALTKGLGSDKKRTNICDIGIRTLDVFMIIISIVSIAILVIY